MIFCAAIGSWKAIYSQLATASVFFPISFVVIGAALLAQSSRESKGWVSLFDGKTMDHWNDPRKLNPPGDSWTIEDGCLKTKPHPRITEDLVSTEAYGDFELQWEWKVAKGGNSGLKYRCQAFPILLEEKKRALAGNVRGTPPTFGEANPHMTPAKFEDKVQEALDKKLFDRSVITRAGKAQIYNVGFEYQMIDNSRHLDAKRGPLYQTGALYSIVPPTADASKPAGEFNQSRLIVQGGHFEHWLNGQKVVDVTTTPEMLKHALAKRWDEGSEVLRLLSEQPKTQCPVALQNHGDEAWFRNIKIRQLQ